MAVAKKAKMEEIKKNLSRRREIRENIARQCEENAQTQKTAADDIREVREKTDRHVDRLERGFDENTGKITIEKP